MNKMKKIFMLGLVMSTFVMMTACKNQNDTQTIILKTEDVSLTISEVGDGSNFYDEPISIGGDEYYVIHSTMACPKIDKGVQRNCYKINAYRNIFCPGCMNDLHISLFNNRYFSDGYKNN